MSSYLELIILSSRVTENITTDFLPINVFQITKKLGITVRNSENYHEDWQGKIAPVRLKNAFLIASDNGYTIYYDENNPSYIFNIAHEVAHYLLKHNKDSTVQENDANLLALLLIAPPDKLKKLKMNHCSCITNLCKVPIELAKNYDSWLAENNKNYKLVVKNERPMPNYRQYIIQTLILIVIVIFTTKITLVIDRYHDTRTMVLKNQASNYVNANASVNPSSSIENMTVYVTDNGKKYHLLSCRVIKDKKSLKKLTLKEAKKLGYEPCEVCRPDLETK